MSSRSNLVAALNDDPGLVNRSPTGDGWFMKVRLANASDLDGLMDEDAYMKFTESQG